jgi:hypothetical protein
MDQGNITEREVQFALKVERAFQDALFPQCCLANFSCGEYGVCAVDGTCLCKQGYTGEFCTEVSGKTTAAGLSSIVTAAAYI